MAWSAAAITASSISRCRTSGGGTGGGDQRRSPQSDRHPSPLNFQEVKEGNAIYYLAVLPYRNEDTYQFTLKIMGRGCSRR